MNRLVANIEPILFEGKMADSFSARVTYYDLLAKNCEMFIKVVSNIEQAGAYYTETWQVPEATLQNWGADDTVLLQAYADEKGFTITSFEQ